MSAIIFQNCEDQAFVATDTLACDDEGRPGLFRSKALYVPHLRTIVFATGFAEMLENWFIHINRRMVVDGVEQLDAFTPETLRELWAELRQDIGGAMDQHHCQTTTVYHMGVSEKTGKIVTYAYRSTNDFASEKLPANSIGFKPECPASDGETDIFELMKKQRSHQQNSGKPLREQVHIGGEIQLYQLTAQGCNISTYARFDDYDEARTKMQREIDARRYLEEWESSISKQA